MKETSRSKASTMLPREEEVVVEVKTLADLLLRESQAMSSSNLLTEEEEEVASAEAKSTITTTTPQGSRSILVVMTSRVEQTQDQFLS